MNSIYIKTKAQKSLSSEEYFSDHARFMQKFCNKNTASKDMTEYGFVKDLKCQMVSMMVKRIRCVLEKVCDESNLIPTPAEGSYSDKNFTAFTPLTVLNKRRKDAKKKNVFTQTKTKTVVFVDLKFDIIKMSAKPEIHEALAPISWLAGRWSTENGQGIFPTIKNFGYHEELEFLCIGQPMLNYKSTSQHPEKKIPMHQERGFLRIKPGTNELALVASHNFGMTSIEEGAYNPDKNEIVLDSINISRVSSAKSPHVTRIKRTLRRLENDTLEMVIEMETEETALTEHLKAIYTKVQ